MVAAEIPTRPVTRRSVLEQSRALPAELPLQELVDARDEPRFVVLLLAALQAGREVDASILDAGASLLRDPLYLGAAMGRLTGDVADHAVAALDDGRVMEPWLGAALCFFAAVWCQREGRKAPRGLVSWARILTRRADDHDAVAAGVATAKLLEDPHLLTLVEGVSGPQWQQTIQETTDWLLQAFVGEPADAVPELAPAAARTGPKVGRNELCPCGSGKKYKRCHLNKPLPVASAVSSVDDLMKLSLPDLLALDVTSLEPVLHVWVVEELLMLGEVDAMMERLHDLHDRESFIERAALLLLELGQVERAKELTAKVEDPLPSLQVGTQTPARAIKALEKTAMAALDGSRVDLADAAHAGLHSPFPAVGILLARAAIADPSIPDEEAWPIVGLLHEVRDRLGVAAWDAASEWRAEGAPDRVAVDREALEGVRQELTVHEAARREAERAFARSEKERARLESEAARARQEATRAAHQPVDAQEVMVLRAELQALKAMHKDVHEERNALRREVAQWRSQAEEEAVEEEHVEAIDIDADEDGDGTTAPSGLRIPELPEGFLEHLQRLPPATGRTALARLGELCSGRPTGWRETKPLQGFDNVWRVKVGRSYRMLFRLHEGRIEVLDLVHRQDLEKKLNQLVALR